MDHILNLWMRRLLFITVTEYAVEKEGKDEGKEEERKKEEEGKEKEWSVRHNFQMKLTLASAF